MGEHVERKREKYVMMCGCGVGVDECEEGKKGEIRNFTVDRLTVIAHIGCESIKDSCELVNKSCDL